MLTGTLEPGERMTKAERAREPRSLGLLAYFDGLAVGASWGRRFDFPRRLNHTEAASWREGWRDGRMERVCHARHGFTPCPGDHPPTVLPPQTHPTTP